jgi:hypothetical protein
MWPPLPVANHIADIANFFFIGSLVIGVVSTVTIVWMTGVKEAYWENLRRQSDEAISQANARAAEAIQKAEEERLARIKIEARLAPRNIPQDQQDELASKLIGFKPQRVTLYASPSLPESEWFVRQLGAMLKQAGWDAEVLPGTPGATILFPAIGVVVWYPYQEFPPGNVAANRLAELLRELGFGAVALPNKVDPPITLTIVVTTK